jgi:outer membrane receptor for ferric coprogen and ferric-rhodotorulic acid
VSSLKSAQAPAYSTADARIAYRFHPQWEFAVVGQNLFQPYHVEFSGDPGGPVGIVRNVYANLVWRSK